VGGYRVWCSGVSDRERGCACRDIFGMNQPGHDGDTYRKHMYLMDVDGK
jgi:hypothetical protein